jgi:hypothetical protein
MIRTALALACTLILAAMPLAGQNYTGTYTATNDQGGQTVVTFNQAAAGRVTGTIVGNGNTFTIEGLIEDESVVGAAMGPQGGLWFEAELDDGELYITFFEPDVNGQPNYGSAATLIFDRASTTARAEAAAQANPLAGSAAQGGQAAVGGAMSGAAAAGGAPHDGTALGQEWFQFLAGKKATQMDSYSSGSAGGYSSRTDVHLCANGQFAIRGNSMVSVDVGGASGYSGGNEGASGTWRVITEGQVAGIELRYANGGVEQYRLDYQDGATYVNGDRWYVTPSEACGF